MSPTTQVSSNCLLWNRQGIFALPEDTFETYQARACRLIGTKSAPFIEIYDLQPSWVRVTYSNKGLRPWEAGCTWIGNTTEIQLNSHFEHNASYLGIYDKDEVLHHEYVHASRAPLESIAFEEIFAYYLSKSKFRKLFGPIFERSWESALLLLSFLPLLFGFHYLFPLVVLALFMLRLFYRIEQWRSCKKNLDPLTNGSSLPLMVRLLDDEIILFSRMSCSEIRHWTSLQSNNFRWKLLIDAYLNG